ncbi:MAG TPA: O-methyltransferase [Candidatus Onthoplasma faecipullorum]|nr:O-methyltransferase [Candidatus Onthoplasma faecipullorum]
MKDVQKLLEEIRVYGEENDVPISKADTQEFLLNLIKENNYMSVLEIGTAIGYSTIAFASTNCVSKVDSVEIDENRLLVARENIKKSGLDKKIKLYHMDAKEFLQNNENKYDFIYLDGPKGQYINYLPYLLNMLNKNGTLVADNLFFHGMVTGEIPVTKGCRSMIKGLKNYIQEITTNPNLETKILNIGDGLGVTKVLMKSEK